MSAQRDDIAALRADYAALLARMEANQRTFLQLARSVYRVQEDERRRLARELHDGLGQNLTALSHQLGLLLAALPDADARAAQLARQALETCRSTLEDTRQLSRLLRPQVLDDLGLAAALRWLCRSLQQSSGVLIEPELAEPEPALDAERQTVLFRVAQEALTNVLRHAAAQHATLRLAARAGLVELCVEDDGIGITAGAAGAGGLGGLRERLRVYGGELQLAPRTPRGTRLRALLPLLDAPADGAE